MPVQADPVEIQVSSEGEVAAGALTISVKNKGSQPVTFNGDSLEPGEAKTYGFVGKPYRAISYNATGSILRILYTL